MEGKKSCEASERTTGNPSRSYLRFSFIYFFVEGNDRLKRGPSEHVHFFVNCGEFNDPKATGIAISRQQYRNIASISSFLIRARKFMA